MTGVPAALSVRAILEGWVRKSGLNVLCDAVDPAHFLGELAKSGIKFEIDKSWFGGFKLDPIQAPIRSKPSGFPAYHRFQHTLGFKFSPTGTLNDAHLCPGDGLAPVGRARSLFMVIEGHPFQHFGG